MITINKESLKKWYDKTVSDTNYSYNISYEGLLNNFVHATVVK